MEAGPSNDQEHMQNGNRENKNIMKLSRLKHNPDKDIVAKSFEFGTCVIILSIQFAIDVNLSLTLALTT